jgi:hypothetical protein
VVRDLGTCVDERIANVRWARLRWATIFAASPHFPPRLRQDLGGIFNRKVSNLEQLVRAIVIRHVQRISSPGDQKRVREMVSNMWRWDGCSGDAV